MASFEMEGKLHELFQTEQRTETFRTREFVIEEQDGNYPQMIKMQVTQDRCSTLDAYKVGDMVKVSFNVRGRAWSKDGRSEEERDGQQGETSCTRSDAAN